MSDDAPFAAKTLYDVPAVEEAIGVPRSTLAKWRHRRVGPAYVKFGGHIRYFGSDLNTWLERQRITTQGA